MNTLLWEVLKDVTRWGQTQKPARTDEVCCINGTGSQGCWEGTKCSPYFIYKWFIDWQSDWLDVWACRCVVRWSGSRVKCHNTSSGHPDVEVYRYPWCKWLHAAFLVWGSWGRPSNSRRILGLKVTWCCRCQCCDIRATGRQRGKCWSGSVTGEMTATMLTQHLRQCPLKSCDKGVTQEFCKVGDDRLSQRKAKQKHLKINSTVASFAVSRLRSND